MKHISGGDPFELGSARPLDFGHWAAHKLEYLSDFKIRHGEAVAIGIALDCVYSHLIGAISLSDCERILAVIKGLGFDLYRPGDGKHLRGKPSDHQVRSQHIQRSRGHTDCYFDALEVD